LAAAVGAEKLGESASNLGDKVTLVKAAAEGLSGDPAAMATTLTGALVDKAIGGAVAGIAIIATDGAAVEVAPNIASAASAASGFFSFGEKLSKGPVGRAFDALVNMAVENATYHGSMIAIGNGSMVGSPVCGLGAPGC
jgi:hypothetical protein